MLEGDPLSAKADEIVRRKREEEVEQPAVAPRGPGPPLKTYYSPIWIAMRWYKARAFMRHHKTPGAASAPAPIKHKGLIPFSSKLVIQHVRGCCWWALRLFVP